jgi:hypothetical protein
MKTFLFCTSYLDEKSEYNNKQRLVRWIDFYTTRNTGFGSESLVLIDDSSLAIDIDGVSVYNTGDLPEHLINQVNLFRFDTHLGRPSQRDYRGWWRSFLYSLVIAEKYNFEKIIHVESDFFITSSRMTRFICEIKQGWTTFYSKFHSFPESGIQVICKDSFKDLKKCLIEIEKKGFVVNEVAEFYFPYTNVEKSFLGDRLGQFDVFDGWLETVQTPLFIDYIGQVLPSFSADEYEEFFTFEYKWA